MPLNPTDSSQTDYTIALPLSLIIDGISAVKVHGRPLVVRAGLNCGEASDLSATLTVQSSERFNNSQVLIIQTTPNDFARIRLHPGDSPSPANDIRRPIATGMSRPVRAGSRSLLAAEATWSTAWKMAS
jgi:hypothetical protein